MTRRAFVLSVLGTAAAFFLTQIGCREKVSSKTTVLFMPAFLSLIIDEKAIRKIGLAYIGIAPNQTTESFLISKLMTDRNGKPLSRTLSASNISLALRKKIEQDFIKGQYLFVDGWVLSETEAQQCALFSLSQK
jgi:hypothetical protein